ncbi:hypothetical protein CAMRE0001_1014 [Campylobacter rectus RM3267]|uniref:Uncharacterized protein n=1 Tax=Campylobacter rectus RM3267 TaxID=553218 RepID=B9D2R8_CAMRE|nr:hypothetical protein [Campylobacter rectus]EEF13731.1 hypothetical protein CAMRE0001_1014 [Campylobacter rectus RM3267]UEB47209.1 hypothetical protein LK437_09400 [Campylobacter rectus]
MTRGSCEILSFTDCTFARLDGGLKSELSRRSFAPLKKVKFIVHKRIAAIPHYQI